MDRGISPARRLVYSIALIPIVPAASWVVLVDLRPFLGPATLGELRWMQLAFSVVCVVGAILIWRGFVLWTLGRVWLTALIGMIPFVQVAVNAPILSAAPPGGCSGPDCSGEFLRAGQHQVGVGVWIWATVWCWWGWERRARILERGQTLAGRFRMSTFAKRILLSLGTLPIVFGFFLAGVGVAARIWPRQREMLWFAYLMAAVVEVPLWIGIWRACVRWDRRLVSRTVLLCIVCVVFPIGAVAYRDLYSTSIMGGTPEMVGVLPLIGWGLWMAVSVWMWPWSVSASAVSAESLSCLKCGYLLTGLRVTRCPECGDEPTLDELWEGHRSDV